MSLDEMPLADFFDRLDADSHSLVVVNRTAPRPLQRLSRIEDERGTRGVYRRSRPSASGLDPEGEGRPLY